jgi:hypothetical protein
MESSFFLFLLRNDMQLACAALNLPPHLLLSGHSLAKYGAKIEPYPARVKRILSNLELDR